MENKWHIFASKKIKNMVDKNIQQTAADRLTPAQTDNVRVRVNHWPSSPQSDLWEYLKPEQKRLVRPILRRLKPPAQADLCIALLDYMETGEQPQIDDVVVGGIFGYLTTCYIRPLVINN